MTVMVWRSHAVLSEKQKSTANAMPVPDLGRAREGPSLFRPLKRGDGRAEQARKKKKPAPVGAPRDIFPLSRFTVPGPGRPDSSRRGCSGVRPGVQLRTTPAGAASRPTLTTPHDSAPRWTGRVSPIVISPGSQGAAYSFLDGGMGRASVQS